MNTKQLSTHGSIRTLTRQVLGNSVVFAATQLGDGARHRLAHMLLQALTRLDHHRRKLPVHKVITLHRNPLGAPGLLLDGKKGPSLSFSHDGQRLWAAMCRKSNVGIDVAYPEEFAGGYPFARAFRSEEMDWARTLCPNDAARGAALAWSAKEASVKAIGSGFNLFDPLDVRVGSPQRREQGFLFEVMADRPITVWARTEGRGWLAVALDRQD